MILPTTKQKPSQDFTRVTLLLYGEPKIGKSTFCSRFENAFFIATEPGLNHLETYNLRADDWEQAWEILEELQKSKMEFSPVVIDTIDKLWDFCCVDTAIEYGAKTVASVSYGRGYDLAETKMKKYINELVKLNTGLIFISHVAYETKPDQNGEQIKKFMPSVDNRVRKIINPLVDIIGFIGIEKDLDQKTGERIDHRIFYAQNGVLWEAGDRTGHLPARFPFAQKIYKSFFENTEVKS